MCACAGLTVHARLCCQPNASPSAISHNSAVWWLIFVFLCCVGLSWRFLFVCCCFVFTFLLFNLSFIYVCVGFFFLFWDFITSSCAFTIYKRNAGLMVRQQVKSASPWVCMFMWLVIWRERHHSFRSGVCVCVPVSNGCSYAIWQAVFYGKSNLGDFVALPDQLNDLWASLIELDSSSQSRAHTPACYISAAYENLFRRAEMIAIHGHKVS